MMNALKIWAVAVTGKNSCNASGIFGHRKKFFTDKLDIYATSIDYDHKADVSIAFLKKYKTKFTLPFTDKPQPK
jgi:hypothetical protein